MDTPLLHPWTPVLNPSPTDDFYCNLIIFLQLDGHFELEESNSKHLPQNISFSVQRRHEGELMMTTSSFSHNRSIITCLRAPGIDDIKAH